MPGKMSHDPEGPPLRGERRSSDRTLAAAALLNVGSFALVCVLQVVGWPGPASECATARVCHCEVPRADAFFVEPYSSWSNVPVFAASVLVARELGAERRAFQRAAGQAFVAVLWLQALGALALHGSASEVGWWLDGYSVLAANAGMFAVQLARLRVVPVHRLAWAIAGAWAMAVALRLTALSIELPSLAILLATLTALALVRRDAARRGLRFDGAALRTSLLVFAASTVVWRLTQTGGAWCHPAFPGHALWHVGAGAGVYLLWRHVRRSSDPWTGAPAGVVAASTEPPSAEPRAC